MTSDIVLTVAVIALLAIVGLIYFFKLTSRLQQQLTEQTVIQQKQLERIASQQAKLDQLDAIQQEKQQLHEQNLSLQPLTGTVSQLQLQLEGLSQQLSDKEAQLEQLRERVTQRETAFAELQRMSEMEKSAADEKLQLLDEAKQKLSTEFQLLANQIFETKQQSFQQNAQSTMDALLKPMQSSLDAFKQRVEVVHKEDLEGRASLTEQLRQLHALNHQMSEEAHNLTQALKGDSKTQGNWGELVLERLLERSGLREGEEFVREKSFTDEHGKRFRPDVVLNLPDSKHVIIDSKVSLLHYEQALNSNDGVSREKALKAHLQSLKGHIDTLAVKRYEHLDVLNAPDFVLMFIPVEGAYLMAIEADASIFENAFEKRVAVVTPTTLFTSLKTIEQLWRYERQSENTVKLVRRAADVHDKFVSYIETFEKLGKQLETVQGSYQQARSQLVDGRGNLVRQAQMLKELAGKTKKELPSHLLDSNTDSVSLPD